MEFVDVLLILLSLAVVIAGQTFWLIRSKRRRVFAALSDRNRYFNKLQEDCQKMTIDVNNRIEKLELENDRIKSKLLDLGLYPDHYSDTDSAGELQKLKSLLEQKKTQLELLDNQLAEVCSKTGLEADISDEELEERIEQLQSENRKLESQLETVGKLVLPTRDADMDPEIKDFLKQEGGKYSIEKLDELYEKLLEEKVADPDHSLSAYEARIKTFDYEAEHQRLNIERKRVENRHERVKCQYLDEVKSFTESRIEYCFKIRAVIQEYNARKELNDTEERLTENCLRKKDAEPNESYMSWQSDEENHYTK